MKIITAKHAGFCFGVKRAIEIAEDTARNWKTYVYGQLVHNERVIEELRKKGIEFVSDIEKIPDNAVTVLRAHGEPKTTYEELQKKGIKDDKLKDATCPLVTLVHNVVIKLKNNGLEYRKGIFSKNVIKIPYSSISNITVNQTLMQRILYYGDIDIDTPGTPGVEAQLKKFDNPGKIEKLTVKKKEV